MPSVKRVFVEKRPGYDVEATGVLADLKENLKIDGLQGVRILNRYDLEGISDEDFERAVVDVLSEPAVDDTQIGTVDLGDDEVIAVEYLPGQYDQRADSAAQCIELLTKIRPTVKSAKLYILSGNLQKQEMEKIEKYLINPVDSRKASLEMPKTLKMDLKIPTQVARVDGFISYSEEEMEAYRFQMGFAMTLADLLFTQKYFKETEQRDPSITELKVIDTYWSDHCRHTTFLTKLTEVDFEEGDLADRVREEYAKYLGARDYVYQDRTPKDVCLMDLATIYVKEAKKRGMLSGLDESEEINACSIREKVKTDKGDEDYLIMFKNETHNHPTEIEPFGGAATCLGGAIRDPLSGRAYVYQAMRVTGSGDPRERVEDTMPFKLPQKQITLSAAQGYSSYGNQIGLATGLVSEVYHEGYKAKRLEIGAVVAAAPQKNVIREVPEEGDVIILIGGATGRDGCGGATGSSKAHDETSIEECGAEVQKGNPLTERMLQRLFRNPEFSTLVRRCNDFGAGGVCVAIGELSEALDIDLDQVPKKYEGLDGTELAISESQERMAVVVRQNDAQKVIELAAQENLTATKVAKVTDTGRMRMFWNGNKIVDLKREFLDTNGAPQFAKALVKNAPLEDLWKYEEHDGFIGTVKALLSDLNICSQKGLIERFDSTIGAGTVNMPLGGKTQLTPAQAMAAKVPVLGKDSKTATIMSYGMDPDLASISPYHGGFYGIVLSVAKLVASGGDYRRAWLTLQEYFERMTEEPAKWGKPLAALLGAYAAQRELGIAAIGGKDSMSGTFKDISVPPTLCSFAICTKDADQVISPELKDSGNSIYRISIEKDGLGLVDFEDLKAKYAKLQRLIEAGTVVSAYAIDRGGALAGLCKMALGNQIGFRLEPTLSLAQLTSKDYGDILVESAEDLSGFAQKIATLQQAPYGEGFGEKVSIEQMTEWFEAPLEKVFPTKTKDKGDLDTPVTVARPQIVAREKFGRPQVVIPVFPGTNCEYDTAAAFERAGARAKVVIIRNRSAQDIDASIQELAKAIDDSQMMMIPGGFSAGDEPDGSGKFIATTLRNPKVADAVMELLRQRDGLMLGICNGFQALIKLGLVPYGEIRQMRTDSPTLTYNTIGRHVSCIVKTRMTSVKSPWLAGVEPGEVYSVAVSHGEGRFVATEQEIAQLIQNGQVATQYVNESGVPTMDIRYNPNGSMHAIEGILSQDGRVFGKMGHSERWNGGLFANVPGSYDQKLFASGVAYFK